jgi:predicted ester cyclase
MLENRLSKEYLEKMFNSEKPDYILRAIRTVDRHPEFHPDFYHKIVKFIASEDEIVAREALKYFKPGYLDNIAIQQEFADVMIYSSSHIRNEILWMFIDQQEMDERVVLKLLKLFDDEVLGTGQYNLILKLVREEHLKENEEINKILRAFLSLENAYVRGLTKRLLGE